MTRSVRARCRVRQGALRRHIRHSGVAGVADAGHRGVARLGAAHRAGDPLQPHRADGRARRDPDGPDHGARGHLLVTLGAGSSPESTVAPTWTEPRRRASSCKQVAAGNGFLTARGLDIAAVVGDIAAELGTTPSRVALARTLLNPAVTVPIVGARSLAQLDDNLGALDVRVDPAQQARLAEVSAIELGFPAVPCAASTSPDKRAQDDAASASKLAASDSHPAAN